MKYEVMEQQHLFFGNIGNASSDGVDWQFYLCVGHNVPLNAAIKKLSLETPLMRSNNSLSRQQLLLELRRPVRVGFVGCSRRS